MSAYSPKTCGFCADEQEDTPCPVCASDYTWELDKKLRTGRPRWRQRQHLGDYPNLRTELKSTIMMPNKSWLQEDEKVSWVPDRQSQPFGLPTDFKIFP